MRRYQHLLRDLYQFATILSLQAQTVSFETINTNDTGNVISSPTELSNSLSSGYKLKQNDIFKEDMEDFFVQAFYFCGISQYFVKK